MPGRPHLIPGSTRRRPVHPDAGAVARLAPGVCALAAATALFAGCSGAEQPRTEGRSDAAVEIDAADPAPGDRRACQELLDALPETVADQPRREVAPADGWGAAWGDPAIVLTCGGPAPSGFEETSTCTTVDGVDWYIPEEQLEEPGATTATAVHRAQHVEIMLPAEHWPPATTLVDVGAAVRKHLRRTDTCY